MIRNSSKTCFSAVSASTGIGVGDRLNLDFESIPATLDEGYPIVTLTKTPHSDESHWVVIYGYGRKPNRIFIAG